MTKRAYRHPNGEFEIVHFVEDTATARAFYAGSTEVTIAIAQAGQAAAEAAKPPPPKTREQKLIDALIAKGVIVQDDIK